MCAEPPLCFSGGPVSLNTCFPFEEDGGFLFGCLGTNHCIRPSQRNFCRPWPWCEHELALWASHIALWSCLSVFCWGTAYLSSASQLLAAVWAEGLGVDAPGQWAGGASCRSDRMWVTLYLRKLMLIWWGVNPPPVCFCPPGREWSDWSSELRIPGDELKWKFISDGSVNGWGWRFTVYPIMPAAGEEGGWWSKQGKYTRIFTWCL